ncbi:MAG: hypothetical protein UU13_C0002G0007 [Candidatus Nomurabacteria bacterium GW2011_GWB1_40_7]|uniref:Transcobalamin-like C-terminal domain-containing protein n=1 Tax=Candidatus Nomurabacteria bacterium GW2011_GWB1_40_7 TaxID=1618744 RepID=A0A0G0W5Y9_9BACT|nr:MAG: hypothetical protein UU13_C0002G0007 [Candidatus Nomurabacteria bacterium GW2011_GWB1_40_7]
MLKNKKILIIVGVLVLVFLWGGQNILERTLGIRNVLGTHFLNGDGQRKFSTENFRGESENVLPETAILEINKTRHETELAGSETVYDFMDKLRDEGKINFTEKTYAGMGKFIVSINGVKSNGAENWIYYVNGKEAQVGVSNYKIKAGDLVSWKYEKTNY